MEKVTIHNWEADIEFDISSAMGYLENLERNESKTKIAERWPEIEKKMIELVRIKVFHNRDNRY